MSGGSLNYLCYKGPAQLFDSIADMVYAEQLLLAEGYKDIAKDVRRLIEYVLTAENRIQVLRDKLEPVFHAIEWYESSDYSKSTMLKELNKYRTEAEE